MLVVAALLATIPEEARGAPLAHHCHYERDVTLDWTIEEARPEALWPLCNDGGSADSHSTAPASMPGGPNYYEAPRKGVPHAGHRRNVCGTGAGCARFFISTGNRRASSVAAWISYDL